MISVTASKSFKNRSSYPANCHYLIASEDYDLIESRGTKIRAQGTLTRDLLHQERKQDRGEGKLLQFITTKKMFGKNL